MIVTLEDIIANDLGGIFKMFGRKGRKRAPPPAAEPEAEKAQARYLDVSREVAREVQPIPWGMIVMGSALAVTFVAGGALLLLREGREGRDRAA